MLTPDAAAALRSVRPTGLFFAVELDMSGRGWRSLTSMLRDPVLVHRRVAATHQAIARSAGCATDDVPLRAAASIDLLALAARVLSPALATCVLTGVGLELSPDGLSLREGEQTVAITDATTVPVRTRSDAARAMSSGALESVIAPLVSLYRVEFRLSPQVLWGDVASALNGAAQALERFGARQQVGADAVLTTLLSTGELAGTACLAPRFRRNNCCLYYRIPGAGICGDCVLPG